MTDPSLRGLFIGETFFIRYMFGLFSFVQEKEFARQLAQQLGKDIPARLMQDRRRVLSVNKITRLLERTYHAATEYQVLHGMGFVKRAVFANSFKWELKNAGYPEDFVDMATEGLVVQLTKSVPNTHT